MISTSVSPRTSHRTRTPPPPPRARSSPASCPAPSGGTTLTSWPQPLTRHHLHPEGDLPALPVELLQGHDDDLYDLLLGGQVRVILLWSSSSWPDLWLRLRSWSWWARREVCWGCWGWSRLGWRQVWGRSCLSLRRPAGRSRHWWGCSRSEEAFLRNWLKRSRMTQLQQYSGLTLVCLGQLYWLFVRETWTSSLTTRIFVRLESDLTGRDWTAPL